MKKLYHLIPRGDSQWHLSDAHGKALGSFATRWEAIANAADFFTPGSTLLIHRSDGSVAEERTSQVEGKAPV
jgi:hypothetical protein